MGALSLFDHSYFTNHMVYNNEQKTLGTELKLTGAGFQPARGVFQGYKRSDNTRGRKIASMTGKKN